MQAAQQDHQAHCRCRTERRRGRGPGSGRHPVHDGDADQRRHAISSDHGPRLGQRTRRQTEDDDSARANRRRQPRKAQSEGRFEPQRQQRGPEQPCTDDHCHAKSLARIDGQRCRLKQGNCGTPAGEVRFFHAGLVRLWVLAAHRPTRWHDLGRLTCRRLICWVSTWRHCATTSFVAAMGPQPRHQRPVSERCCHGRRPRWRREARALRPMPVGVADRIERPLFLGSTGHCRP